MAQWALTIPEEGRKDFLDVLDRESLLARYRKGERHISFTYWTRTATYEPMLAEDHLAMFEDEKTGDILGVNYVLDRTEQYRLKQYKAQLEQKTQKLEALLEVEKVYNTKLYLDALTGAYNRRYYEEVVHDFTGPSGVALMDLDDFKKIPLRVGVAYGIEKKDCILGVLRGEYINVLITDEEVAQYLVDIKE